MPRDDTIKKFIFAFPKLYFFIRPHHQRDRPKRRESARHTKNEVRINQIHFNVLWLIDLLIEREGGGGCCREGTLRNIFLWRQPKDKSQFDTVISGLRSAGLIRTVKDDLADGRVNWFALTPAGQQIVKELRKDREETAKDIFKLLGLTDDESAEAFVAAFSEVAERAWRTVEARAGKQAKKSRAGGNGRPVRGSSRRS